VMHDDLTARDGREDPNRSRAPDGAEVNPSRPGRLSDREVPIELTRTPDQVHAWLDGELPESAVRGADSTRHVEFWKRMDRDLEVRRQAHAPADLTERIMAVLPMTTPRTSAPWWNRSVAMNPIAVAATAAGLLALGTAIGATIKGR
jgi:hypothetical protein